MTVLIKGTVEVEKKKAHFYSLTRPSALSIMGNKHMSVKANWQRDIFLIIFQIINAVMALRYTKHVCCMEKYS